MDVHLGGIFHGSICTCERWLDGCRPLNIVHITILYPREMQALKNLEKSSATSSSSVVRMVLEEAFHREYPHDWG